MSLENFKSKKIKVFRNADIYAAGKKLIISKRVYRNFEQLLHGLSLSVKLNGGAVRRLFTIDGVPVDSYGWVYSNLFDLDELEDGGVYVATSGEPFKRVSYALTLGEGEYSDRRETIQSAKKKAVIETRSATHTVSYFSKNAKALRVIAFVNGQTSEPQGRLLLSYKNCKNFDQFLNLITVIIHPQTGQVKKVFDASTGKRVLGMKDLYDGLNVVGVGYEPFKKGHYNIIHVDSEFKKEKEEIIRKTVSFYPNGDSYHNGWTVTVKPARYPTLKKLIDNLNRQISLVTGLISQIYTIHGRKLNHIDELEQNHCYVLVSGGDPFFYTEYNVNDLNVYDIHNTGAEVMHRYDYASRPESRKNISRPGTRKIAVKNTVNRPASLKKSHSLVKSASKKSEEHPRPKSVRLQEVKEDSKLKLVQDDSGDVYESENVHELRSLGPLPDRAKSSNAAKPKTSIPNSPVMRARTLSNHDNREEKPSFNKPTKSEPEIKHRAVAAQHDTPEAHFVPTPGAYKSEDFKTEPIDSDRHSVDASKVPVAPVSSVAASKVSVAPVSSVAASKTSLAHGSSVAASKTSVAHGPSVAASKTSVAPSTSVAASKTSVANGSKSRPTTGPKSTAPSAKQSQSSIDNNTITSHTSINEQIKSNDSIAPPSVKSNGDISKSRPTSSKQVTSRPTSGMVSQSRPTTGLYRGADDTGTKSPGVLSAQGSMASISKSGVSSTLGSTVGLPKPNVSSPQASTPPSRVGSGFKQDASKHGSTKITSGSNSRPTSSNKPITGSRLGSADGADQFPVFAGSKASSNDVDFPLS